MNHCMEETDGIRALRQQVCPHEHCEIQRIDHRRAGEHATFTVTLLCRDCRQRHIRRHDNPSPERMRSTVAIFQSGAIIPLA